MTKRNKQVRLIINIILAVWVLGLLALVLSSCNPVKRVLKDPVKFQEVFNEGVSRGMCVNDTIILSKSDTLISYDTLYSLDVQTDTFNIDREIVKIKTVVKTVSIRDTLTKVVTDNSRIELLQKELFGKTELLKNKEIQLSGISRQLNDMKANRNEWRFRFFLLALAVALYLFRKPLLKLISPLKLPI
jgi:hypothetical protein